MSLHHRLRRLERAAPPPAACARCGTPTGRDGRATGTPPKRVYRACFDTDPPAAQGPDTCPGCGAVLRREYRATFR